MKTFLFFVCTAVLGQVHADIEGQVDGQGGSRYVSTIVTEQFDRFFLLQRFFPSQGRMPRYELGVGRVWSFERAGPCKNLRLQPYTGWARESGDYLLTSGVASAVCGGHKAQVIIDRKNGGNSFQYNRVTINVYKHFSFRWDGFYRSGWLANQIGGEVEVPVGSQFRHVLGTRHVFVPRSWIFHYGFRL